MRTRTRRLAMPLVLVGLLALPALGMAREGHSFRASATPVPVHGGYRDGHRHDRGYRHEHDHGRRWRDGHREGHRWRHDRGRWNHWDHRYGPPVTRHRYGRYHHGYRHRPRGRIDLHFWLGGYR